MTTTERDTGMLRRLTAATISGHSLDGYDLGVIAILLPLISDDLDVSPVWAGLIGASTLIGIFCGAPVVGWFADQIGRRALFSINIGCFVGLGVLQAFAGAPWQLFVCRFLLGVAVGAEYALGASMLSEFTASQGRGRRVSGLLVSWYCGYLLSVVAAYALVQAGLSWRWILATSVLPALVTFLLRQGLPESPRYLMGRGRVQEARAVADRYLGGEAYFRAEEISGETGRVAAGGFARLWEPGMRARTVFVCVFYAGNVAPYFAIFTFAPQVFEALGIREEAASTIAANVVAALGAVAGMLSIERIGRRRQGIGSFWVTTLALLVVGLWAGAPAAVVVGCFIAFAFANAFQGNLVAVYPVEIFPTELRSTGIGVTTALSRIAAAVGTFLLPVGIDAFGIGPCMLIAAAVCGTALLVSQRLAPETTGLSLTATSARGLRRETAIATA